MPRQAHVRLLQSGRGSFARKKKTTRNRGLDALEIAERENPDELKVHRHRLGKVDDDGEEPRSRAEVDERSSKRRKIDITREDESEAGGSDLEGNRWHEGVDDEDEDSDIDSEEAFGASDEENFADFTFKGSATALSDPKRRRNRAGIDQDKADASVGEDDNITDADDDDDFGDEGVDLATAWDMHDEEDKTVSKKRRKRHVPPRSHRNGHENDASEDSDGGDSDEDASEANTDSQLSMSDDEGDLSRLQDFVQGLTSTENQPTKKLRHVQSLPDKPSQFGLSSMKISAADLLQHIKDPRQRQSLKILQNNEERGVESYKGGIPGKLAPPLAKRQQDRLDRSAAYDETKKELGKWVETVKQNRRAEHLSFPLVDAAAAGMLNAKQLGPTSAVEPMTSLEETIQSIMKESGMLSGDHKSQEDQEQDFEELQEKQMSLAEVQARRAELRQQRDLMFREEIRARRIKKIKSKAYRRVHRKERQKADDAYRSLKTAQGMIDSDEERDKNDRCRAEERMGARHRESKWAKSVKATGRAAWDNDARHGVTDLARRDEELRRRMEGKADAGSDESESESASDSFGGFSESEDEKNNLSAELNNLEGNTFDSVETRLGSMAFMIRAEASRKTANDEEIHNIRRSLHSDAADPSEEADSEKDPALTGRQVFGATSKDVSVKPLIHAAKSEFEEFESEPELEEADMQGKAKDSEVTVPASAAQPTHTSSSLVRSSNQPIDRRAVTKSKPIKKDSGRSSSSSLSAVKMQSRVVESRLEDHSSSSGSELEQDERTALAQAIFAGSDEVQQDFAKEKKETVEDEGDQVIDNRLPGWGNWAGEGISKKAQKRAKGRFLITVKGVSQDKRQDAKLDKVIINEKRVKKTGKYLANDLPHPFESRQQYERSLRLPLGPEWTTKTTFQDATKPRVLIKQGIIRPMAKPMAQ